MLLSAVIAVTLLAGPKLGDVAPDFTATDIDGKVLTLSKLVEKGNVVLAFFPKAFTGGCTRELTAYTERFADLKKADATVIAISGDSEETQKKFRDSLKAPFSFIADTQSAVLKTFDAYGMILNSRVTYVIGKDRKVLAIEEGSAAINPESAVQACSLHAADALKTVLPAAPSDAGTK